MTDVTPPPATLDFDAATRALVRLSARIAAGSELDVRDGLRETTEARTPARWVEEVILQSYLFAGFPRALNAMRELRRVQGNRHGEVQGAREGEGFGVAGASEGTEGEGFGVRGASEGEGGYRAAGEATCAQVYGKFYAKLRHNIVALHPDLDEWMILEGYGKVLSRPGLDLGRRELCIVASCVAAGQDRQLHSHLHGARNVGVADEVIAECLDALDGVVKAEDLRRAKMLWAKVRN